MKMAVMVMGGDPEFEPVSQVAVNYGIAGALRAVPFHAAQRRCYLPEDLIKAQGISLNMMYERGGSESLSSVAQAVAGQMVDGVRPSLRFLKAADRLAFMYKGQMRANGYDVFSPKMQIPPAFKEMRLAFSAFF
jgi:phytoene synthase